MATAVLKRFKKEEKGFTLIELLAVIVILGIIAAIAIPMISGILSKSRADSDEATARQIYDATRMYITSELNGVTPITNVTLQTLVNAHYLDSGLILPSTKEPLIPTTTAAVFTSAGFDSVQLRTTTVTDKNITAAKISQVKTTTP
ncbi:MULTISPECIES: prepilin-type N-terminal cleavage/methylation domain-containing protein [Paenibacillus]|uniref:prepilin-type N-terminal cleavage/methylation domain-containing protein n=1 Tax=Paenibacillus TaxID=44249 RepID=UPI0022B8993E|nr:prepilin-type N-terminal cleavage/methylation domain-containing protein [Paenibacillus caseinilyticus]MCZ8519775.1 prepilin-type N-terminal cleavage/methylation domain-containing protein [Paenibacillus caseinilyticus]